MKYYIKILKSVFFEILNTIINWLSFNSNIETLVDSLNHKLEEPVEKLELKIFSHPGGFIKEIGKRRMNIAHAYIKIALDHNPNNAHERLAALKILIDQSLHAKTINMPINTARVQISLIKEAIKAKGNKRKQMEALYDFGLASFGQEGVIRKFLKRFDLIEVPEEDNQFKDLDLGWDDHVHDFLSEGRKTPTQIILDAFVKGISRLTLVYPDIEETSIIHEALTAGQILGIGVKIGIEFSVGKIGNRRHYMFIPPVENNSQEFFKFFSDNIDKLKAFLEGIKSNINKRRKKIIETIEYFNNHQRPKINQGYPPTSPCWMPPLEIEYLDRITISHHASKIHLGELLYQKMKDIYYKRVLELKAQLNAAKERFKLGIYSEWEMKNIKEQYELVRRQYEQMSPFKLYEEYIAKSVELDYDSEFEDESQILDNLLQVGGSIVWIHPLEVGLNNALSMLIKNVSKITHVETFNLRDSAHRNPNELIVFNKLVYFLNNGQPSDVMRFLEQHDIQDITKEDVLKAFEVTNKRKIIPICGSDSIGKDPTLPGMGFIKLSCIPEGFKKFYLEKHFTIPKPIAQLIINKGVKRDSTSSSTNYTTKTKEESLIVCMGRIGKPIRNYVGDEIQYNYINLFEFWQYLNPVLKNIIRISIGFTAAITYFNNNYAFSLALTFALVWFFITGIRNILVDLIASAGTDFNNWTLRNVNWDNLSQSLFWTGFSVPILGNVKYYFDELWPYTEDVSLAPIVLNFSLARSHTIFELAKFFVICLANGIYIYTHNTIRNFDSKVKRANFFRTLMAWPLATAFSSIGNWLQIPSIVQAKFWSDFVGGVVEGWGKFNQRFILRQRDLSELLPKLDDIDRETKLTAFLDILYIWAKQPRGKTCLKYLLLQKPTITDIIKGNKISSDILQQRKIKYFQYYTHLCNIINDPGILVILCDFILKNFKDREALVLTDLVGNELEGFRKWLNELRADFDKDLYNLYQNLSTTQTQKNQTSFQENKNLDN